MSGLARWCVRHRNIVIGAWIALLVVLGGVLGAKGSAFTDATRLPSSDSSTAQTLLGAAGSNATSAETGTIVWHTVTGSAVADPARSRISAALQRVAAVDGVRQVVTPFTSAGAGQVSGDRHTAYATVVFTDDGHADQAKKLAENAAAEWLSVQTGGTAFTNKIPSEIGEVVGVLAALAVLLLSVLLRRSAPSAATG